MSGKKDYQLSDKIKIAISIIFLVISLLLIILPLFNFSRTYGAYLRLISGVILLLISFLSLYRALTKNIW
ncbi:MAG: hypothetical protein LKI94_08670 [Sporolactobacillus sp.]|jgi:ABC-type nickel/cobalt efflux system permease component RcnA|nr:hypothetical protein [Sporolactobacillus sp.]